MSIASCLEASKIDPKTSKAIIKEVNGIVSKEGISPLEAAARVIAKHQESVLESMNSVLEQLTPKNENKLAVKQDVGKDESGIKTVSKITDSDLKSGGSIRVDKPAPSSKYYQGISKTTAHMQVLVNENGDTVVAGSINDVEQFKKDHNISDDIVDLVDIDLNNPNSLINKFKRGPQNRAIEKSGAKKLKEPSKKEGVVNNRDTENLTDDDISNISGYFAKKFSLAAEPKITFSNNGNTVTFEYYVYDDIHGNEVRVEGTFDRNENGAFKKTPKKSTVKESLEAIRMMKAEEKKAEREKAKQAKLAEKMAKEAEKLAEKEKADKLTREVKAYDQFRTIQKERPSRRLDRLEKLADEVGKEFPNLLKKIEKEIANTTNEIQEREERKMRKGPSEQELKDALKDIDDSDIIDLDDDYSGEVLFQEGDTSKKKPRVAVVNDLAKRMELNKSIKTVKDVQDYIDKINEGLPDANKLGEGYAEKIFEAVEKRRLQYKTIVDQQTNIWQALHKKGNEFNKIGGTRLLMLEFLAVDYTLLSDSERKIYREALQDYKKDQSIPAKAMAIARKQEKERREQNLRALNFDFTKLKNRVSKLAVRWGANPATLTAIVSKYNRAAGMKLLHEVYAKLMTAATKADLLHKDFSDKMDRIATKYKTKKDDHVRAQMFGVAFATNTAPGFSGYWDEVYDNLNTIIENSENKRNALEYKKIQGTSKKDVEREIAIAKELKRAIIKEKLSPEESKILTEGQKALYNGFRDFSMELEPLMRMNTESVWGADFKTLFNYMPKVALGKFGQSDMSSDEIVDSNATNLMDVANESDYGRILAARSGFTKPREKPKGYYYDYNIMSVARRWSKSLLFDGFVSNEIKILSSLMSPKNHEMDKILGPNLREVLHGHLKDLVSAGRQFNDINGLLLSPLLKAADRMSTAIIATSGQLVTQMSSAIPAAMIYSGGPAFAKAVATLTGLHRGSVDFGSLSQWMKENGMGIQVRDIIFERFNTVEDLNSGGWLRDVTRIGNKAEEWTTTAIRHSDKQAARLVWLAEFYKRGGTLDKPTKEAILSAERAVGLMQNMSNLTFAAPMFKSKSLAGRAAAKVFYAFKSFAVNAGLNTWASAYYINGKHSDEAKKVLAANIAMSAAYTAASMYVISPFYNWAASSVGSVLAGIFGGDAPDASDDDDDKNVSEVEEFLWRTGWDMMFGQLLPEFLDQTLRWVASDAVGPIYAKKLKDIDSEEYNKYTDFPLYAPKNMAEAIGTGTGVIGDMVITSAEITSMGLKTMLSEETEDLTPDELARVTATAASYMKIIPFRGDFQKILRNYIRQVKNDRRQEAQSGGGGGGDKNNREGSSRRSTRSRGGRSSNRRSRSSRSRRGSNNDK